MFKIMLADDEGIMIDSLKFLITKEFGDEVEIEYAKTGRNVIELAEAFRPDIAIMDIQMPGINGIEAMREIRKNDENVVFIVLSAYDKFDYAAQAIELGALEYLTKPMEKTKMVAALKKAMAKVNSEKKRRSDDLLVKEKLETVIPLLESGFLYRLLTREYDENDVQNYRTLLDFPSENAFILVLFSGDEREGNRLTNTIGTGIRLQRYHREIREIIKLFFNHAVGMTIGNEIVVLVPYSDEHFDYNGRIDAITKAREMARKLHERTDTVFRVGIGGAGPLRRAVESYMSATKALRLTTNTVAHADDISAESVQERDYPSDAEGRFYDEAERGRYDAASAAAKEIFVWMTGLDLMDARLKAVEMALKADECVYRAGGARVSLSEQHDYLPSLMRTDSPEALWNWLDARILAACANAQNRRVTHSDDVIDEAKAYINANYTKGITLEDVSREVNISPYYFSRIFKEASGENFIDYLTNLRIERAKLLLSTTNHSMKVICAMVGYSDPNYFSKSFKKNVGVTPTEYREG